MRGFLALGVVLVAGCGGAPFQAGEEPEAGVVAPALPTKGRLTTNAAA